MSLRHSLLVAFVALLAAWKCDEAIAAPAKPPKESETAHVTLYPAPEPHPALKYELLPPFLERRPGNAAVWWNRIPAEQQVLLKKASEQWESRETVLTRWLEMPVGTPQEKAYRKSELAKVVWLLRDQNRIYGDMERAARFEHCDWELPIREGRFFDILLPDAQQSRMYARLLAAKAHLEIAEGQYDRAVRTLQTGYAQGRDVAQGQTLVNGLVGLTIAGLMSHEVLQLIQQPDAPNLYWALSTLPRPLVSCRPGAEAERRSLYLQFPELRDLDKKTLSADESRDLLNKLQREIYRLSGVMEPEKQAPGKSVPDDKAIEAGYPRAKRYLVEHGYKTATAVEAMPVAQVVLLYSVKLYDELSDDQFKWRFIPTAEAGDGPGRAAQAMRDAIAAKREILPLAALLLPATMVWKDAETGIDWNIAALRILEAMRLYAANHNGQWPDRLTDITEVPVPQNPCDGKSFTYERHGDHATLTSKPHPHRLPWRFEITLKQREKPAK